MPVAVRVGWVGGGEVREGRGVEGSEPKFRKHW